MELDPTRALGIIIPNKHPKIIPIDSAHKGYIVTPVVSSNILPQKVPKNAPKKSLNVFPYPAHTLAS